MKYIQDGNQNNIVKTKKLTRNRLTETELYEGVSKSFRTERMKRELQMVHLSATRCSCIAILRVILVSFAAITLCVASQRVFIVVVYFVIDSVRKHLDTASYVAATGAFPVIAFTWTETRVQRWNTHVLWYHPYIIGLDVHLLETAFYCYDAKHFPNITGSTSAQMVLIRQILEKKL
jgi:hypothetical protein